MERQRFTLHDPERDHKQLLTMAPEGFLPKDRKKYDAYASLDDVTPEMLTNRISELPDNFFREEDPHAELQNISILRFVENIGDSIFLTGNISVQNAYAARDGLHDVRIDVTSKIYLNRKATLEEDARAALFRLLRGYDIWENGVHNFIGKGMVAVGLDVDGSFFERVKIFLPKTDLPTDEEYKGQYNKNTPFRQLLAEKMGYGPLIEVGEAEMEEWAQRAKTQSDIFGVEQLESTSVKTKQEMQLAMKRELLVVQALVRATKKIAEEIARSNNLSTSPRREKTVLSLEPTKRGCLAPENILKFFAAQKS